MPPERDKSSGAGCLNPQACPPVVEAKERWEQMRQDYQEVKKEMKEVGQAVGQTNIHLAEQGAKIDNLVSALNNYDVENSSQHDQLFNRLRVAETAQAVSAEKANHKLSWGDLFKLVIAIATVVTLLDALKDYLAK